MFEKKIPLSAIRREIERYDASARAMRRLTDNSRAGGAAYAFDLCRDSLQILYDAYGGK